MRSCPVKPSRAVSCGLTRLGSYNMYWSWFSAIALIGRERISRIRVSIQKRHPRLSSPTGEGDSNRADRHQYPQAPERCRDSKLSAIADLNG
jgi:hypothetical protein